MIEKTPPLPLQLKRGGEAFLVQHSRLVRWRERALAARFTVRTYALMPRLRFA